MRLTALTFTFFRRKRQLYWLVAVPVLLLLVTSAAAQEIPKGVRYKTAPDSVNASAKKLLESALASDTTPNELFGDVCVIGPMLWKALKVSADKILLDSKPIVGLVQIPEPIQTEGKRVLTSEERHSFWSVLVAKYPTLKTAKIRKAHSDEISYYWATIPFDIEEPFFVVETGSERFVVQFLKKNEKLTLFWIDLVGDLRTLKP